MIAKIYHKDIGITYLRVYAVNPYNDYSKPFFTYFYPKESSFFLYHKTRFLFDKLFNVNKSNVLPFFNLNRMDKIYFFNDKV